MGGIKLALGGMVFIVMAAIAGGFLLPAKVEVARSIEVEVSPQQLFPYVNNFHTFNSWSPWAKIDPQASYRFEGPEAGVGARMAWSSEHPSVGQGSQEIKVSKPYEYVEVALDFGDQGPATARYELEPVGEATKITWSFQVDFGNDIMGRYVGLMFDRMVGAEYEKGLAKLKSVAEAELGQG